MDNAKREWRALQSQVMKVNGENKANHKEFQVVTNTIEEVIVSNNHKFAKDYKVMQDKHNNKGAGDEVVNTCYQLIGMVSVSLYNLMADVYEQVRLNCGSCSGYPLISSQLGQIKNLEEEVHNLKAKIAVQDDIISNLVSDNLEHLQLNAQLMVHINRSEDCWVAAKTQFQLIKQILGHVGVVLIGDGSKSLLEGLGSGGDNMDNQDGREDRPGIGISSGEKESSAMRELRTGVTDKMAGSGWWYNSNKEDVPKSWSATLSYWPTRIG